MVMAAAAALTLAFAGSARAAVEPGVGIAGIEVGMTVAEVIAAKGEPDGTHVIENVPSDLRVLHYGKTKAFFDGHGDGAGASSIRTTSRGQRTDEGAGVGWTEERLRRTYRRLHCGAPGGFRVCDLGRVRAGHRVTYFYVSKRTGRVREVAVSLVHPD